MGLSKRRFLVIEKIGAAIIVILFWIVTTLVLCHGELAKIRKLVSFKFGIDETDAGKNKQNVSPKR